MREVSQVPMFASLPDGGGRWGSFASSFLVQLSAMALIIVIGVSTPKVIERHYEQIGLVAPYVVSTPPPRPMHPQIRLPRTEAITVPVSAPRIVAPVTPPVLPRQEMAKLDIPVTKPLPLKIDTHQFDVPAAKDPGPKVEHSVKVGDFGSSATQTLSMTNAAKVQTGGFGDPNGVPANANSHGRPNIAAVGSFDLPQGGGYGNGTGGTKGARGVIASAGFGNGVATGSPQGGNGSGRGGHVQMTTFTPPPAVVETPKRKAETESTNVKPLAIQSKPQPVYTAEARQLGLEGEVIVQALFSADGKVRVLHLVRGLGHGLDEAAVRAAEGIRFTPAQRDGRPVDSTATLHIVFQLS